MIVYHKKIDAYFTEVGEGSNWELVGTKPIVGVWLDLRNTEVAFVHLPPEEAYCLAETLNKLNPPIRTNAGYAYRNEERR